MNVVIFLVVLPATTPKRPSMVALVAGESLYLFSSGTLRGSSYLPAIAAEPDSLPLPSPNALITTAQRAYQCTI
jgi:hypothetical protein